MVRLLVASDYMIANIQKSLRDEFNLEKDQAFYIYSSINKKLMSSETCISEIYQKYKGEDGFLTLLYTNIKSFG